MISRIMRGGLAGLGATATMTIVMLVGMRLGLMQTPPPKEITARAERSVDVPPSQMPQPAFDTSWLLAHAGYGAGFGALYALLRPIVPGAGWLMGSVYGLLLWSIGYLGLMPAFGLYPPPEQDNPGRVGVMVVAHEVYGLTLGELNPR